jgi:hypothetical protein
VDAADIREKWEKPWQLTEGEAAEYRSRPGRALTFPHAVMSVTSQVELAGLGGLR